MLAKWEFGQSPPRARRKEILSKRLTKRTYRFALQFGKPRTDYSADELGSLADVSSALSSSLRTY